MREDHIWYFLPAEDMGHRQMRDDLQSYGIACEGWRIHEPEELTGVRVRREYIERAVEVLGLVDIVAESEERDTDYEDVIAIIPKFRVKVSEDHMETRMPLAKVAREFMARMQKNFNLTNPHGHPTDTRRTNADTIYVKFWCRPGNFSRDHEDLTYTLFELFGERLSDGQTDCLYPADSDHLGERGYEIRDGNQVVAQVVGNVVYILFDLPHSRSSERAARMFRSIMEVFCTVETTPGLKDMVLENALVDRMRVARESYITICKQRKDNIIARSRQEKAAVENNLSSWSTQISGAIVVLDDLNHKLHDLNMQQDKDTSRFDLEYTKLTELSNVDGVVVGSDCRKISVYTGPITAWGGTYDEDEDYENVDDEVQYELGRYRIEFYPYGLRGDSTEVVLRIQRRDDSMDFPHPHVSQDGEVCLGNLSEGIAKMLGAGEYALATSTLIAFLGEYNHEDPYSRIYNWRMA